jgi:peptide/nickel transport system permease protein
VAGFVVAIGLLQVFSFQLRLLPAFGSSTPATVILPGVTLAIALGAATARLLTSSLRDALNSSWAETARATGASEPRVLLVHAMRNALPAVVAQLGVLIASLLGGAVVVEDVFGRNGLGALLVNAVSNKDFPVVQALTMLSAAVFAVATLAADALHLLLDPRLRARHNVVTVDGRQS